MDIQYKSLWRKADLPLVIILGAFVTLSLIYAWATPPLEASDELWHFGMVNAIADTGQLPIQQPGVKTPYEQEGSQPPLYYIMAAFLVHGIDRSDFDVVRQPNPHAVAGIPGNVGNKNLVLHDNAHPVLQRTVLAIYLIRLFSIFLGCITVISIYAAARQLGFGQSALPVLAASLTAFNPMFLFITASVNNDNLVTALNSLIVWQIIVLIRNSKFSLRGSVFIAVLVAFASLSKLSGLVLLPFALLGGVWVFWRPRVYALLNRRPISSQVDWRGFIRFVLLIGLVWLFVAGWWYLRNIMLYGEIFGTGTMVAVAGPRIGGFGLQTLLGEFQGFRFAYWALFGAVNIMTYRWFYDVMDAVTVLMVIGLLTALFVTRHSSSVESSTDKRSRLEIRVTILLLVLIVLVGTASVAVWTSQTYASQGRLLFPFNAAISILGAIGIVYFGRYWLRPFVPVGLKIYTAIQSKSFYYMLPLGLACFSVVVPFVSIAPQYALPEFRKRLPDAAHSVYARFGDIVLAGYEVPDRRYLPGDKLPITVYWQVLNTSSRDYSLYLHATLDDGTVIGKVDSYPGGGRLRTSTWQSGAIYADSYEISLDKLTNAVSRLRLHVGWWDYDSKILVNAVDQDARLLNSVMLDVGGFAPVHSLQQVEDLISIEPIVFGNVIELIGYRLDDYALVLLWKSIGALPTDNTVFVQALDDENQVVGQGDAPPTLPTRYWQVGEQFITRHIIAAPAPISTGTYRVIVGWYNPSDSTRLSVSYPDNAFTLPVPLIAP